MPLTTEPFVGRESEMAELTSALDEALLGRGGLAMVAGEPGIGKTSLIEALEQIAVDRGAKTLWGRCYEEAGAPPYWPWVQVLRSYIRDVDVSSLLTDMGRGAAEIAELAPELRQSFPDLPERPPTDDPNIARFRLFEALASFIRTASSDQSLVLILEDLHAADRDSLLLLEFLARELSETNLLIIGTYRDLELSRRHPLSKTLAELTRSSRFHRMLLPRLDHAAVERLVYAALETAPPAGITDAIYGSTEGNPLFITEILRVMRQEDRLSPEALQNFKPGDLPLPEGVRETIGRHLAGLSDSCNELLTVAAIMGRQFEYRYLALLTRDAASGAPAQLSEEELGDLLDEAINARVLAEIVGPGGGYQFTHAMIRETLIDDISSTRQARLHARVALMLEEFHGRGSAQQAAQLAFHFGQAEAVLGPENMVRYLTLAGERAIDANAYEEALAHFQKALAAIERESDPRESPDRRLAKILFGLGQAQVATFTAAQYQESIDTLKQAFDAFVELNDTANAVAVPSYPHPFIPFTVGTADMTARAMELIAPDSLEAGHLLYRCGHALFWEARDYVGAQVSLDKAVAIARREGDSTLEVRALYPSAQLQWVQSHNAEAVELSRPIIKMAESQGDLLTLVWARGIASMALVSLGAGDEAQEQIVAGIRSTLRLHNSGLTVAWKGNLASLALLRGDWQVAKEAISDGLDASPDSLGHLANGVLLHLELGDLEQSNEFHNRLMKELPTKRIRAGLEHAFPVAAIPLFCRTNGTTEGLEIADAAAESVLSSPTATNRDIVGARAVLAMSAIQRGNADSASGHYSFLVSQQGTQLFPGMCADHLLGLVAQATGDADATHSLFESALNFSRNAGYYPELAWTHHDYADALLGRNASGDRITASEMNAEAIRLADELAMKLLLERAQALQVKIDAGSRKRANVPAGLSPREVEVIHLVATGKSNGEIAEALFITLSTVKQYMSNIFDKTDSANRTEAAAFANRNGLI